MTQFVACAGGQQFRWEAGTIKAARSQQLTVPSTADIPHRRCLPFMLG
jgi:hypothetical protein